MIRIQPFTILLLSLLLSAFSLTGCGGGKTTFDPTGKHKMEEIGQMLTAAKASNTNPPARLEDLDRVEPLVPLSVQDLRSGEIVYVWGASLSTDAAAAKAWLAHEKKTASEGGWVLMQDGSVKQMTAQEFGTSSKAKSK